MPVSFPSLAFLFSPNRKRTRSLDVLPNDILVDVVFNYLDVVDILRLRRVSKLYYHLTHHAVIWKRLVCRSTLPLPPLPPTARHSLKNLTGLEAERLLTRAHSLDLIWREKPKLFDQWTFESYEQIAHMVLLPGSQYLVASASDRDKRDWCLIIFVLDHRNKAVPIVKTPTKTKAYNLKARYMTISGEAGITISYVRRDWRHRKDGKRGINVSEYSDKHDIDAPYPIKYECIAHHVPLKSLEELTDPRLVPGSREFLEFANSQRSPFRHKSTIRSSSPLEHISLDDFYGSPYVIVVKYPNTVIMKSLLGHANSMLHLTPLAQWQDFPHRIKAIRPLPEQKQLLVFREITVPPTVNRYPITSMEMWDIPDNKDNRRAEFHLAVTDSFTMLDDKFADIQITDHCMPNWIDDSVIPDVRANWQADEWKLRTISAFCRATAPDEGLLRITFYPRKVDIIVPPTPAVTPNTSTTLLNGEELEIKKPPAYMWRYDINWTSPIRFIEAHLNTQYRILPGSLRTLLYTVPWDDITSTPLALHFYRYHDREVFAEEPEVMDVDQTPRYPVQRLPFEFQGEQRFQAVAWDETTGRIVFSMPKNTRVVVLDFAKRPREDCLGRRLPLPAAQDHTYLADSESDPGSSELDAALAEAGGGLAPVPDLVPSGHLPSSGSASQTSSMYEAEMLLLADDFDDDEEMEEPPQTKMDYVLEWQQGVMEN